MPRGRQRGPIGGRRLSPPHMPSKKRKPAREPKPKTNEEALAATADDARRYPTPLQTRVLEGVIAAGNHFTTACKVAGVTWDTFQGWRERGSRGDPNLRAFVEMMDRAEVAAEQRALAIVMACAEQETVTTRKRVQLPDGKIGNEELIISDNPDRYRAAAWVLEHRFSERYARMRKLQHSGALTHRQVVILHEDDPSLVLHPHNDEGQINTPAEDATYELEPETQDPETGPDGER